MRISRCWRRRSTYLGAGLSIAVAVWFDWRAAPAPPQPPRPAAPSNDTVVVNCLSPLLYVKGGGIWRARGDGQEPRRIIANAAHPCWSPDRRRIAFVRGGQIWVADAQGRHQRQVTALPGSQPGDELYLSWDPVDDLITFSREATFEVRLSAETARTEGAEADEPYSLLTTSIYDVRASSRLAPTAQPRLDLLSGGGVTHFSEHSHPAWSADGKHLAFCRNGDVWVATRRGPRWYDEPMPPRVRRTVADWAWDTDRLVAVAEYDQANYRACREIHCANDLSWSPNGRLLAYSATRMGGTGFREVHILAVETGDHSVAVRGRWTIATDGVEPSCSPDGRYLAYVGTETGRWTGRHGIVVTPIGGGGRRLLAEGGSEPAW